MPLTAPRAAVPWYRNAVKGKTMGAADYPRNLDDIYAACGAKAARYPQNLADVYDHYADLQKRAGDEPVFPKEELPDWRRANPTPPQPPQVPTLQEMQTHIDSLGDKRRPMPGLDDRTNDVDATRRAASNRARSTNAPTMPTPTQAALGQSRMRNVAAGHGMTQNVGYTGGGSFYLPDGIDWKEQVRINARDTNGLPHEYWHNQQQHDILTAGGPAAAQTHSNIQGNRRSARQKHIQNMYLIQDFARNGGFNAWVDRMAPPGAPAAEREAALRQIIDQAIQQYTPEEVKYELLREREATEKGNAAFGAPSDVNTLYDTPASFAALYDMATDPRHTEYMPFHQDNKANWVNRLIGPYNPKHDVSSDQYDPYYNPQM